MSRPLPCPTVIRQMLDYDASTGLLRWKVVNHPLSIWKMRPFAMMRRHNSMYAGNLAIQSLQKTGYLKGKIVGRDVLAHRVAFCIFHGRWPLDQMDHINGIRSDNRIENLRESTPVENAKNRSLSSKNTSGVVGVEASQKGDMWYAKISVDGKRVFLGSFPNKEQAVRARWEAEEKLGFSERCRSRVNRLRHPAA